MNGVKRVRFLFVCIIFLLKRTLVLSEMLSEILSEMLTLIYRYRIMESRTSFLFSPSFLPDCLLYISYDDGQLINELN